MFGMFVLLVEEVRSEVDFEQTLFIIQDDL